MQQEHFSGRFFWIKLTGSKWNQNWSAKTKISLSENYTLINLHKMPEDISRWTTMTKKSYENKQTLADDSQRSSLFDHHQSHQYIFHNLEPYSTKRKKHVHIVTLVMNRTQAHLTCMYAPWARCAPGYTPQASVASCRCCRGRCAWLSTLPCSCAVSMLRTGYQSASSSRVSCSCPIDR